MIRPATATIILSAAALTFASAGVGTWTGGLPEGGAAKSVVHHPTLPGAVVVSPWLNGAFRSLDGGSTWSESRVGLPLDEYTLGVGGDGTIYGLRNRCCFEVEVFRSDDGGASWSEVSPASNGWYSRGFVVDQDDGGTAYFVTDQNGAFKTSDGGASWTSINNGLPVPLPFMRAIAIDPSDRQTLYLQAGSLYRSEDGGGSWTSVGPGLSLSALAVDPANPQQIFGGRVASVHRSQDGGVSWTQVMDGEVGLSLAMTEDVPGLVLVGTRQAIFRSTDNGDTWTLVTQGQATGRVEDFSFDPFASGVVLAATDRGPLRSIDNGLTWDVETDGLDALVSNLDAHPTSPGLVVASGALSPGIHRSTDSGASWSLVDDRFDVFPVVAAPSRPTRFYGVADLNPGGWDTTVVRSDDGGATWQETIGNHQQFGFIGPEVMVIAVDPEDSDTVIVGNWTPFLAFPELTPAVLKSTDAGVNWEVLYRPDIEEFFDVLPSRILIDPDDRDRIFVGLWQAPQGQQREGAILRTLDGGGTWENQALGGNYYPTSLTIDAVDRQTLYLLVVDQDLFVDRFFKTIDGGDTWNEIQFPMEDIDSLAADPLRQGTLYAAGDKVYVSRDGAVTWEAIDASSLPAVESFQDLSISSTSPRVLHVGTTQGVYSNTTSVHLEVTGSCPGSVSVTITNGPPDSEVAVVAAANTNGWTKGGVNCNGTIFEIGEPFKLPPTWIGTDSLGDGSSTMSLPSNRCWLEALEAVNCSTSRAVFVD